MSDVIINEVWDAHNLTLALGDFNNGNSSMSKTYVVENAETEEEAVKQCYDLAPAKINDESGNERIPKMSASIAERCGENKWKVTVEYGYNNGSSPSADEDVASKFETPEVCFQCSATTIHVTRAYDQLCPYSNSNYPAIANPAKIPIGWNGMKGADSDAMGVDAQTAELREEYRKVLTYDKVRSSSWRRRVAECVGRVNSGEFKGWQAGECMFMGATYDTPQRGVNKVKVTFSFMIRVNEQNASVCGHDIGLLRGFEYAWVVLKDSKSSNSITKEVAYIFKSSIARSADFSKLGI